MSNKLFVWLLIGILVVGAGMGGAFAGGVAYGRGQEDTDPVVAASSLPSPGGSQVVAGQAAGAAITEDLRARLQSGNATPEELQQLRESFQGQNGGRPGGFGGFGGGGDGFRFGGGGALNGTIESVVDGVLTINTPQGPLQATVGADTTVRSVVEVSVEDLVPETRVTVTGERFGDGVFEATSVLITPEGLGLVDVGGLQGGFDRNRRQSP